MTSHPHRQSWHTRLTAAFAARTRTYRSRGLVWRLLTETDELEPLGLDLDGFLAAAVAEPVEVLGLHPLRSFRAGGGVLRPGQLLSVYPPFATAEAAGGVSLRPVGAAANTEARAATA